jgi:hypothetical protein
VKLRTSPLALAAAAGSTLFLGGALSGWLWNGGGGARTSVALLVLVATVVLASALVLAMVWALAREHWQESKRSQGSERP